MLSKSKLNKDIDFIKLVEHIKKEEKKVQFKILKFKEETKFFLIKLGNLNFNLIKYKIKSSNLSIFNLGINDLKKKEKKEEYKNFKFLSVKITKEKIEYKIDYINFIKERNTFYILFTILVGKIVEVSIKYVFEGKLLNYFIFYEIFVQDFFSFMNRILNEFNVFESYIYDKDTIIPKATIQSINISLLKKIGDKNTIKYI